MLRMEALKRELRIVKQNLIEVAKKREKLTEEIQWLKGKVATTENKSKEQEKKIQINDKNFEEITTQKQSNRSKKSDCNLNND